MGAGHAMGDDLRRIAQEKRRDGTDASQDQPEGQQGCLVAR